MNYVVVGLIGLGVYALLKKQNEAFEVQNGNKYIYSGPDPVDIYRAVEKLPGGAIGIDHIANLPPKTMLGVLTPVAYENFVKVRTNIDHVDYFFWVDKRFAEQFADLETGSGYGRQKTPDEVTMIKRAYDE